MTKVVLKLQFEHHFYRTRIDRPTTIGEVLAACRALLIEQKLLDSSKSLLDSQSLMYRNKAGVFVPLRTASELNEAIQSETSVGAENGGGGDELKLTVSVATLAKSTTTTTAVNANDDNSSSSASNSVDDSTTTTTPTPTEDDATPATSATNGGGCCRWRGSVGGGVCRWGGAERCARRKRFCRCVFGFLSVAFVFWLMSAAFCRHGRFANGNGGNKWFGGHSLQLPQLVSSFEQLNQQQVVLASEIGELKHTVHQLTAALQFNQRHIDQLKQSQVSLLESLGNAQHEIGVLRQRAAEQVAQQQTTTTTTSHGHTHTLNDGSVVWHAHEHGEVPHEHGRESVPESCENAVHEHVAEDGKTYKHTHTDGCVEHEHDGDEVTFQDVFQSIGDLIQKKWQFGMKSIHRKLVEKMQKHQEKIDEFEAKQRKRQEQEDEHERQHHQHQHQHHHHEDNNQRGVRSKFRKY